MRECVFFFLLCVCVCACVCVCCVSRARRTATPPPSSQGAGAASPTRGAQTSVNGELASETRQELETMVQLLRSENNVGEFLSVSLCTCLSLSYVLLHQCFRSGAAWPKRRKL